MQQYFTGVWAYDLTQLTQPATGWASTTWVNLVPDTLTGNTSPSGRSGHSVVNYEGRLILVGSSLSHPRLLAAVYNPCSLMSVQFGGYSHVTDTFPHVTPQQCAANKTLACTWYQDVWVWEPTLPISVSSAHCTHQPLYVYAILRDRAFALSWMHACSVSVYVGNFLLTCFR